MMDNPKPKSAHVGDYKPFLLLAFALVASEVALRAAESVLSSNIAHINEIPALAAQSRTSPDQAIVVVGNSLANNGIDADVVLSALRRADRNFNSLTKIVPDATTIWSWYCLIGNQFPGDEDTPSTVLIAFAWNQLSNQSRALPTRMGAFFCSASDLFRIGKHMPISSAVAGEFYTAQALRIYAHRQTIRNLVLSATIPNYQRFTQQINRQQRQEEPSDTREFSYSALEELLDTLQARGTRTVIVAMPVLADPYVIDPTLLTVLANRGVPILDYRHLDGIGPDVFLDDMHLSSQGAVVLSLKLAADLEQLLPLADEAGSH